MFRHIISFVIFMAILIVSGCVAIPTKTEPAAYTQAIVQDAIRFYEQEGRAAAIAHYSSPENTDGEWYVFIIGESGHTVANPIPGYIGADMRGDLGMDINGYRFGYDLLSTDEDGLWVDYVFINPATNTEDTKHAWVVRHDGLIFGSGWYEE